MYSMETENQKLPTEETSAGMIQDTERVPEDSTPEKETAKMPSEETTEESAPARETETRTPTVMEATTGSPQSQATAQLTKNVYLEMAKEESTLLKSALAVSSETCNKLLADQTKKIESLTTMNGSLVERIKGVVYSQLTNYHDETVKSVESLLDTLKESNAKLADDLGSCVDDLKGSNGSFRNELKSSVDRLEKNLTDSIGSLEKKTDEAIQSLKERTVELSKVYREITETSLEEVKTARAELKEELRHQPETKKETADLLRTNIESVAKDLSGYFRQELSGSVSELNTSLKKARAAADETEAKVRRGGRFSRVMRAATPIVLFACCIVSVIGLFV